jgi:isoaspartyl peptidase/L-asparaginase-like protein (Ntn-hydrolase superfamily)
VEVLEDDPLFNAGRGSVLTSDGLVEMDAAVMSGRDRRAGAVAAVTTVRHPVRLALGVMERSSNVMLAASGAERFAQELGLERLDPQWFVTERQRERWQRQRAAGSGRGDRGGDGYGTVGAVVVDGDGHVAAATSTGGMQLQPPGRVGDSPIVGAGTYADDATCALSATGDGEQLMLLVAGHEVASLIEHRELPVSAACESVLAAIASSGGEAGMIAVDSRGNFAMPFNTDVMYRGWKVGGTEPTTAIEPDG